jgi:hypothetical protein
MRPDNNTLQPCFHTILLSQYVLACFRSVTHFHKPRSALELALTNLLDVHLVWSLVKKNINIIL